MNKKFSAIKFQVREEIDRKRNPAIPRGDVEPRWFLSGEELTNKISILSSQLLQVEKEITKIKKTKVPKIISVQISGQAIAKSYRSEINSFFTSSYDEVVGITGNYNFLYETNYEKFENINTSINNEKNKLVISAVEKIDIFKPKILIEHIEEQHKIKIIKFNNNIKNNEIQNDFDSICKNKGIDLKKTEYTEKITIYSTTGKACVDMINDEEISEFIYEIEPMPYFEATMDGNVLNKSVYKKEKDIDKNYIKVGVIDTGIAKNDFFNEWILPENDLRYTEEDIRRNHGTMVSSMLLYGDELVDSPKTGAVPFELFDATAFPGSHKISEVELVLNIKEILSKHSNKIKLWNLSLGTDAIISDENFSDFAVVLDEMQSKYNILICKSAGNYDPIHHNCNKICDGAESLLSLVVGSITNQQVYGDSVGIDFPSKFSRIGRAPANIIKPDLVYYGGNDKGGIHVLNEKGCIRNVSGTSFSTPRVTSIIAGIQDKMGGDIDPILLKALLIHSGKIPEKMLNMDKEEIIKSIGFGLPLSVEEILTFTDNKSTLILRDSIRKKNYIEILDFPYPESLSDDEHYNGKITITLVFKPYLDSTQGIEYCQSNIDIEFGTYSYDDSMINILEEDAETKRKNKNLMLESNYSKRSTLSEVYLIKNKQKYYPVKKYSVDLRKLTKGNKKHITKDKKWYMKISQLFREKIESEYNGHVEDLEQPFCLIVSFEDPTNTNQNVYDDTVNKLVQGNFIYNNIVVENQINIQE